MRLPGFHLTYPHTNGFHGGRLVLARQEPREIVTVAWPGLDDPQVVHRFAAGEGPVWFDVAADAGLVAWVHDDAVHVADLADPVAEIRYTARPGHRLDGLCGITPAGDRIVFIEIGADRALSELSVATGEVTVHTRLPWLANHAQYSPYDPAWIGFAHEGPATRIIDRVWAWHDTGARCLLDQTAIADGPGFVAVGHERWLHHDLGAVVVAYGESAAGPRGLYTVGPDRPAELVAAGDRFWHCDMSRDGRLAVVDTQGPHDAPGRGAPADAGVSDVLLVSVDTGATTFLARTWAHAHPQHPHPVFSPDGRAVLFNHTDPGAPDVSVAVLDL